MKHILFFVFILLVGISHPLRAGQWFSAKSRAEADTFYKTAFAAYEGGDYPRAHVLLDQAEKLKPDQADGWNLRGAIFLKQGTYDKAESAFGRAAALDPQLWAARFNQAETAFKAKNYPVARVRFDRLVSQTNRFKEKNKWELAQYKAFLSSLLMNDETGARKRLGKLPTSGGATPAVSYAQAATAYRHQDLAGARKVLAAAQISYSASLNNLFSDSLATLGWQSSTLPIAGGALAANTVGGALGPAADQPAYVIDPKLEAAAAEPLPAPEPFASGRISNQNVVPQMLPPINASPSDALLQQQTAATTVQSAVPPIINQESALERGTLLD